MVTLSSADPHWLTSKWLVEADTKAEALHFSTLMHAEKYGWDAVMVTICDKGANPTADLNEFTVVDPAYADRLQKIYLNFKERLRNC